MPPPSVTSQGGATFSAEKGRNPTVSKKPKQKVISPAEQSAMLDEIEISRLETEKRSLVESLQRQSAAFNREPAEPAALPSLDELVEAAKTGSILAQLDVYAGAEQLARRDAKAVVKAEAEAVMEPLLAKAREIKKSLAASKKHMAHVRAVAAVDVPAVLKRVPVRVVPGQLDTNLVPLALYFRLADDIAGSLIGDLADLDRAAAHARDVATTYHVNDMAFRAARVALETFIARAEPSVAAVAHKLITLYKLEAKVAADLAIAGPLPNIAATPTKRYLPVLEEREPIATHAANWDPIASQRVEPDVQRDDPRLRVGADLGSGIIRGPRAKDSQF